MSLAVCMLFDSRGDRLVRELWARLEDMGVRTLLSHTHGRHQPHLSWVVLRTYDTAQVGAALRELPAGGAFTASSHGVVLFPRGRVGVVMSVTADVVRRQELIVDAVRATGADVHRHYAHGHWVPHVSLATSTPRTRLAAVAKAVSDVLPLELEAARAALIETATGEVRELDGCP